MKRSAMIFGATGLVGKTLVDELLLNNAYDKVWVVVRKDFSLRNAKLDQLIITDFSNLSDHKRKLVATDYFCCIGTTIKKAGSQEAFRQVDLGIPLQIAQLARDLSIPNLVMVSSIGADVRSSNFYLKTKGEMENSVRAVYIGNLKFVRPSLLLGNRQEYRSGERIAVMMMKLFGWLLVGKMKKYRAIDARDVARAMIRATQLPSEKVFLESDDLLN